MTSTKSCLAVGHEDVPTLHRQKAVLTCPHCDHASPPDGDWIWMHTSEEDEIHCPDCYECITVRGATEGDTSK